MAETRKEIFEELKSVIPTMKAMKSELIYEAYKPYVKTLDQLAKVQEQADEEDINIVFFEELERAGIDTYEKLEEVFEKSEEGIEIIESDLLHNAVYAIYSFVDYSYQEQNNPDFLALDE